MGVRRWGRAPPTPPVRRWGRAPPTPPTAKRFSNGGQAMPRGCKPIGDHALSNAVRQSRYRARHPLAATAAVTPTRPPTDRRSRPQRWSDAVGILLALQAKYADWLAALPESLQHS